VNPASRFAILSALVVSSSLTVFASAAHAQQHWVSTWATAPVDAKGADAMEAETTYRDIVRVSLGGASVRLTLSNQFGTTPLRVEAVTVAKSAGAGAIDGTSMQPVLFAGEPATVIPAGQMVTSDPVAITVAPLSDLAVSLALAAQTIAHTTEHAGSRQTNYSAAGNQVHATTLAGAKTLQPWRFLLDVDVKAPAADSTIVCFGDSITDGTGSTMDANMRWPSLLAARMQANPQYAHFAVVDEGIGGNRILHFGNGPSALDRWKTDALDRPGVKYVILLESINDIGHSSLVKEPNSKFAGQPIITADDLITAMKTLIIEAHARGVKVIGATLTPFKGAGYERPDGEIIRGQVNAFIRTGGKFDGVFDFAKVTQDPSDPQEILRAYNDRDHLHPNDTGYKAMVQSIDLGLFQ
jgi:lysophospholipase L1-like esterase